MWKIEKIISKGDYKYCIVRNHPKRTKNDYVLLHRVILENYLGRILEDDEIGHHVDNNKFNNKLSNLELMLAIEHAKLHGKNSLRKFLILKCPWCDKEFELPKNQSFLTKKGKYPCNCCSNSCRGKLYSLIQHKGITDKVKEKINKCILKEFKK